MVIHLGTNDVTRHDSGDTILNVTSAIYHAKKKFPEAGIAIASVPPRKGSERSQKKANEATASVNSYMQAMSRRTKTVHYIDRPTHTLLVPKGYPLGHLYSKTDPSGVHYNNTGKQEVLSGAENAKKKPTINNDYDLTSDSDDSVYESEADPNPSTSTAHHNS